MYKIAILASGSGSNARKIMEHFANSNVGQVSLVVTNRKNAGVLSHAADFSIPTKYFFKDVWANSPEEILSALHEYNIDFIVLAGFLLKVPDLLVDRYPNRVVNIHPALLPKYGGKGMYGHHVHEAVKAAGENESGMTIHFVNHHYDEGGIIFQAKTAIDADETADDIQKKVLALEHAHYPAVIEETLSKLGR